MRPPAWTLAPAHRWRSLRRWAVGLAAALAGAAAPPAGAEKLNVTVQDSLGRPLENAVVSVMVGGTRERAGAQASAEMAQRERSFVPHVLVVQTGTPVSFPNLDTVRHHVYSFSAIKPFEIKLYVGTPTQPVVFDRPGTAVLGCNIHDKMVGFIHVVDTPYFARTGAAGGATLDLPPGEHRVRAWHPVLQASGAPVQDMARLAAGGSAALTIRLPAN
ncbi:MAG TPA: methylamine utilization protein [Burkholderiaceae bacterium]|jgi:plastocyanin|nr:methylamine utilization protein [Burkholderiaceae bacterium]